MAKGKEKCNIPEASFRIPQASEPVPGGVEGMAYHILERLRFLGFAALLQFLSIAAVGTEVPIPGSPGRPPSARPSAALRAQASSLDGWASALDLSAGTARFSFRLSGESGKAPEAKAGTSGVLWVAGPVRHSGTARVLADPCADSYLFTGSRMRPLVLDFDSPYYGAFAGSAAGVWYQDAAVPRMGVWAGKEGEEGLYFGAAAALSCLPETGGYDSWFEEEPPAPERLLAAGMAWAGIGFPTGGLVAAAAVSEEDRGGLGWAFRAEGEYGGRRFRASGRFSGASAGWRGLAGTRADLWEARADASWSIESRLRLEGRLRVGRDADGIPDWETLIRIFREGRTWRWGAELGGCDSSRDPPVRLDPSVWVGREGQAVRTSLRASWVSEGAGLTRTELSSSWVLGTPGSPNLRLEGARRWTTEGPYWKAAAAMEIPGARGAWTARAGTGTWTRDGAPATWELAVSLRYRVP